MMYLRWMIILLLCVWSHTHLNAQTPLTRNFTKLQYQAGTQNWDIVQLGDGRMAFANNDGMLIYDGDVWNTYQVANYTAVHALYADSVKHRIYAGASNEFGYFAPSANGTAFTYHSLSATLAQNKADFGEIWNIGALQMGGGKISFQSKKSVFIVDKNDGIITLPIPYRVECAQAVGNSLIIACKEAVYSYHHDRLHRLPGTELLQGKSVRAIFPYFGKTCFLTADNLMFLYDGKQTEPHTLGLREILGNDHVYCAAYKGHYIAIGTISNGVIIKDLQTQRVYNLNASRGLLNNTVLSLAFDRQGNVWLGQDNGIAYVMLDMPFLNLLGQQQSIGTGYASLLQGQTLYLGTNQGLFSMPFDHSVRMMTARPQAVSGVDGQIWSLRSIDGTVLCGADAGAFVVEGQQARQIAGLVGAWDFLPLNGHPGYVLTGDYNGFAILRREGDGYVMANRLRDFHEISGGFLQDADGSIYMSHWLKGIYRLTLKKDLSGVATQELFNKDHGLLITEGNLLCRVKGRVYVSTVDGFYRYNPKTKKLEKQEWLTKVFDTYGVALRVNEAPDGSLWAWKKDFFAVARPQKDGTYKVETFSYSNIINRLQMSIGYSNILDADLSLFNQNDGFFLFDNHIKGGRYTSRLMVRSVYGITDGDTLLYSPTATDEQLRVSHRLNSLRMEFVLPEYRDEKAVVYSYQLEGYDKRWSDWQSGTSKEYTHLPKGTYVFRVKARNLVNGFEDETSLKFTVQPAWYETWLAYLLYMVAGCVLVYLLFQRLKMRADRELKRVRMEQDLLVREQEAQVREQEAQLREQEAQLREQEAQLREQEAQFAVEEQKKEKEVMRLRSEQLEVELKHKAGELADSTMNLVRKNDMLTEIDSQMEELSESVRKDEAKTRLTKKIADIRRGIKLNMNDDDNWDKFQENFNLVYDNFVQKLSAQFPDLKKNDLKLCVYLRMGLSSKEMASLLNTSVRSIETARYRLRKKLQIDTGSNLQDFIQSFA